MTTNEIVEAINARRATVSLSIYSGQRYTTAHNWDVHLKYQTSDTQLELVQNGKTLDEALQAVWARFISVTEKGIPSAVPRLVHIVSDADDLKGAGEG